MHKYVVFINFLRIKVELNFFTFIAGGHTIGIAHRTTFSNRLYNFTGSGDADPSLDPTYAEFLKVQCPNPANPATTVELHPKSCLLIAITSEFFFRIRVYSNLTLHCSQIEVQQKW